MGRGHTLVARHQDVGRHLEVYAEKVAESVVFFEEEKVGAVGHAW
jgi:hypothetical protein